MRHDWRSLQDYLDVHDRIIRSYHTHMEAPKVYTQEWVTDIWIRLTCQPIFLQTYKNTRVRVDLVIDAEIDDSQARPRARTFDYTFSVNIPGGKNLIRYCSPHLDEPGTPAAPGHHRHHHRHDFTSGKEKISLLEADARPYVGEFLEEVMKSF